MKGLTRLSAAVAAAFSSPLVGHSAAAQGRAPNIVVIVADDLGYADLGAHGGKDIPTRAMVALRQGDWKLVSMHDGPPREEPAPLGDVSQAELYNLKNDIGETRKPCRGATGQDEGNGWRLVGLERQDGEAPVRIRRARRSSSFGAVKQVRARCQPQEAESTVGVDA